MSTLSTLRVGGPVAGVCYPASTADLSRLLKALSRLTIPWQVVGRGSNILAADSGLAGVVILLGSELGRIRLLAGEGLIHVEAGRSLAGLLDWCAERGLGGLEFAAGIPGTVGGALKMNAGAWGHEMSEVVEAAELMSREGGISRHEFQPGEFGYRSWPGLGENIISAAVFRLRPASPEKIKARCRELIRQRREKQPKNMRSAGSFFKNPPDEAAGRLIEEAGLKGLRVGGAMVSTKHANFLVNEQGATARDFVRLMRLVQEKVKETSGIDLEPEVRLMGRFDDP
ncbi:UDP-N-acetylenolpyruvoylglucosamine reductase [hydrothermal vent metagenome]|uniref:UDP-N-acetylmuramate dehydrogenase n=1 Tax=hydrothermal vent metagenome TaxID=652676 RepID=A0A3B0V598_9ZZZZ